MINDYKILGLNSDASLDEVKKAYKKLAIKCHPDKNSSPDATEQFRKITEAYNNIINPNSSIDLNKINNINDIFNGMFSDMPDIDNIFSNIFSQVTSFEKNIYKPKGNDILKLVDITLEDIYNENNLYITYDTQKINENYTICKTCNGKGKIPSTQQMGPVIIQSITYCNNCNGEGYFNLYLPIKDTINIDVPIGFMPYHNNKKIIKDKGLPLLNGINGDLHISFNLLPHNKFKQKEFDLYINMEITFKESLIGFIKEITHLDSRVITINSESIIKPNTIKCINDEGLFNNIDNKYGDLYIKFKIIYPNSLNEYQKKFINDNF
jgi:DnaJ-class molecular chaperone